MRRLLPFVLCAGLAACGAAPTAGTTPAPATTAAPASTTAAPATTTSVATPEALRFTATTVDGKAFDGATLSGKPVVFWFWAAWCPKCRGDAAKVRDLQQQLAGKVAIVGVAGLGSGDAAMKKFVADYQLPTTFPQLADDAGVIWKKFAVPSQHYYVIADSKGTIVHKGPLTTSQLSDKVAGLS